MRSSGIPPCSDAHLYHSFKRSRLLKKAASHKSGSKIPFPSLREAKSCVLQDTDESSLRATTQPTAATDFFNSLLRLPDSQIHCAEGDWATCTSAVWVAMIRFDADGLCIEFGNGGTSRSSANRKGAMQYGS